MKFYLSTQQITELESFSFKDRQTILTIATNKLTAPQKFILNLLKLCLLIPPFWFLAQLDSWMMLVPVIFLLMIYVIVLRPLSLGFAVKQLPAAIKEFQRRQN